MTARASIRVLVTNDHAILRSGLRLLISGQPDMEVVGEAGDFGEAIELAKSLLPDGVTLDEVKAKTEAEFRVALTNT